MFIIVDYFSHYPFLFQMSPTTATAVIDCLTEMFALQGMSLEIFIDDGQILNSKEWYMHIYKYGFKIPLQAHTTFSPIALMKGMSTP